MYTLSNTDVVGIVKPALDVHTLGILSFVQILRDAGIRTELANDEVNKEIDRLPCEEPHLDNLARWIRMAHIDVLGFSYRLDPTRGVEIFRQLVDYLQQTGLLARNGGQIVALWFAALPSACAQVVGASSICRCNVPGR